MAGIYFHIPFCKTRCSYCDFYSTTDKNKVPELIKAELKEVDLRKNYLSNEVIETIYFGGGTPSLISPGNIEKLINTVYKNFKIDANLEITIEVNPDDINSNKIKLYNKIGVNRISVGLQSFNNEILSFINRRHDAAKSLKAIEIIKNAGYKNISVDLIYGIPNLSIKDWEDTINKTLELNIQHISAYHLSFEKGTKIHSQLLRKEINQISDNESFAQYNLLCKMLKKHNFEHYEISNFSLKNLESKHNSAYWQNKKYLGIGPSAHSFDGNSRQWNVKSLNKYIESINSDKKYFSQELLTENQKYNEFILISLRTNKGLTINDLKICFNKNIQNHFLSSVNKYIDNGKIKINNKGNYIIPEKDWFISDGIISDLFITN